MGLHDSVDVCQDPAGQDCASAASPSEHQPVVMLLLDRQEFRRACTPPTDHSPPVGQSVVSYSLHQHFHGHVLATCSNTPSASAPHLLRGQGVCR